MDDLIISSQNDTLMHSVYEALISKVEKSNFAINLKKSHSPCHNLDVFNISICQNQMEIMQERFNDFMKEITPNHQMRSQAIIAYANSVNNEQAIILNKKLNNMIFQ